MVDGRFELGERLGGGGMGTVWRARDLALGRDVALKEVRPPDPALAEHDPEGAAQLRARVLREAQALARINHPHVATIYHIVDGADHPYPWLVMELVPGENVAARLARGTLDPAEAARLGRGVLAGLVAVHAAGIQHRDVKPANILIRPDGRPVLTDFGIAAIQGSTVLTAAGSLIGTPDYMAPERAAGQDGDAAADLWSLGMMLYVAVEGRHPMRRANTLATLAAIVGQDVPPPRKAGALTGPLTALLARSPAARPDAAALDRLLAAVETAPTAEPAADRPAAGAPGADRSDTGRPVAENSGTDNSGTGGSGAGGTGAGQPVAGRPGTDRPAADGPGADGPLGNGPAAATPDADRPAPGQPPVSHPATPTPHPEPATGTGTGTATDTGTGPGAATPHLEPAAAETGPDPTDHYPLAPPAGGRAAPVAPAAATPPPGFGPPTGAAVSAPYVGGAPGTHHPAPPYGTPHGTPPGAQPGTPPAPVHLPPSAPGAGGPRRRRWYAGGAAGVLVLAGVLGWQLLPGDEANSAGGRPEKTGGPSAPGDQPKSQQPNGADPGTSTDPGASTGPETPTGKKITIGVKADQPGFGVRKSDGSYAGFDVDVATYVARALGHAPADITWKPVRSSDREAALTSHEVDLVVATYTINESRAERVDFAGPYLVAHQDVLLAANNSAISKPSDLNGKRVCSVTGSTPAQVLKDSGAAPQAEIVSAHSYALCVNALEQGTVDAVTTDDALLAGYAADRYGAFRLGGFRLSGDERYGVGLPKGSPLKEKVEQALKAMATDGTKDRSLQKNLPLLAKRGAQ
ncbi:protein kinase domain-containing protein [Streptomyces sp. 796.1]|uniref:bifunctional serine/threonine-protein kinase/glutamate ABC transporter substrate-binding protein n=1 Tax=Streptomyces sp. 796.1 TaxID=3163029 RepID=UPI0039C94B2B